MTFVGFEDGPGAVQYYNAAKCLIGVSRDAWFNKNDAIAHTQPDQELDLTPLYMEGEKSESGPNPSMPKANAAIEGETHPRKIADYHVLNNPNSCPNPTPAQQETPTQPNNDEEAHFARTELAEMALATLFDVPSNLKEANASTESDSWQKAMCKELDMLEEWKTWQLEKLLPGRSVIGCTWMFVKKFDADGNLSCYKACLIAKDSPRSLAKTSMILFLQWLESFHNLIAMAALLNLELGQMDITGAYLNGNLSEEIYMRQPTRFDNCSGRVCRLLHTLYGLKQSGREWNNRLNDHLVEKLTLWEMFR